MPRAEMKFLDIVVDCPDCGERVALLPVACNTMLVKSAAGTYLTAEVGDVPRERHSCVPRSYEGAAVASSMNAEANKMPAGRHDIGRS